MPDRSPFRPEDEAARILAAIVDSSDDAIVAKDLSGVILTWNHGAERLYGYTADEARGRSIGFLFPEGQADELAMILDRVNHGLRVDHYETVRRTKKGQLVDVSLSVSPIRDTEGLVIGASAIARNISTRKKAELAMRASEARWRSIVESAVDGIVVIDVAGRIEGFNPAAERLFGYGEAEVLGRNVNILMPAPYHEAHDGYMARYVATGEQKIIGIGREVTALHRDGRTFPVRLSVGEWWGGGERKFTGLVHDLTARVRLEEQLREQSSLVRLGEMAAVIAHEVKNPLAGIRGAIQVIGGRLPQDGKDAAIAKEIIGRIDALNDLMKDLLLFARPPQPKPSPVDVVQIIAATANLLGRDPSLEHIRVQVEGVAPLIMADAELLKIVFLNLLLNGAHAMRGHGRIRVPVRAVDRGCQIAFIDAGPGIPADIREKIFTPFFTTKSRGTGLGLPTARQLVEAHAGHIRVDCPPGGGTVVTVDLPGQDSKPTHP